MTAVNGDPTSVFVTAPDGLTLHVRCHGRQGTGAMPVVCLPGLARTAEDFDVLAAALAGSDRARRVVALDYRGRGLSDYDGDWRNYAVPIAMQDVIDLVTIFGLAGAAVIGTSRGGLIAMVLAAVQPTAIGALVLNDIGPVVESSGLARISGYVGRTPTPTTWAAATKQVRDLNHRQFPAVLEGQWEEVARRQR